MYTVAPPAHPTNRFCKLSKSNPGAPAATSPSHPRPFSAVALCPPDKLILLKLPLPMQKYNLRPGSTADVMFSREHAFTSPKLFQLSALGSYFQKTPTFPSTS